MKISFTNYKKAIANQHKWNSISAVVFTLVILFLFALTIRAVNVLRKDINYQSHAPHSTNTPTPTSARTVPTNLKAIPVSSSENLIQWKASSDDKDVANYNVYRNGTKIATTAFVTYYSDTGLSANTTYTYTVSAYDAAGNTSAQTGSVTGNTHATGSNVVVGNPSNPAALEQEITDAYNSGASSVTINPGTYIIPHNDFASLTLKSLNNFVINGYGVIISAVQSEKEAFGIVWCNNLVVRGLTVQYNTPQTAQGTIVAKSTTDSQYYFDVQLESGYLQDPTGTGGINAAPFTSVGYIFDHVTHQWKHRTYDYHSNNVQDLGGGKWRLFYDRALPSNVVVGDLMAFRGPGRDLMLVWVTYDSIFQDVTMRQGGAFGVKEDRSGRNSYYGIKVTYGPKPAGATNNPLISQSVDGFHSIRAQGGPDIQSALFEGMPDDGIAIHGYYTSVVSVSGNTLTVTADDSEATYPSFRAGDPVRVSGNAGFIDQATITAVQTSGSSLVLTLDQAIAAQSGYRASNPNHNGSDYQLIHNTIRNNRARGMILQGDYGKVLNNTIDGSTIAGILFIAPSAYFGSESDYAWHVLVSGNTIKNTGFATSSGDAGGIQLGSDMPTRGHLDITIRNNVFDTVSGVNVYVAYAKQIKITTNSFLNPHQKQLPTSDLNINPNVVIWLTECNDVTVAGNTVTNPGPYETGYITTTATAQGVTIDW